MHIFTESVYYPRKSKKIYGKSAMLKHFFINSL